MNEKDIRKLYLFKYEFYESSDLYGVYSDPQKLLSDYEYVLSMKQKNRCFDKKDLVVYELRENQLEGVFERIGDFVNFDETAKCLKIEEFVKQKHIKENHTSK